MQACCTGLRVGGFGHQGLGWRVSGIGYRVLSVQEDVGLYRVYRDVRV